MRGVGRGGHLKAGWWPRRWKLLKRIMKKYGAPRSIVTDRLRAYSAAMREVGNADRQEVGGRAQQSRGEFTIEPFPDDERALLSSGFWRLEDRCRSSSSVHAQVHNYFNQETPFSSARQGDLCKWRRSAALAEWRALVA